MGICYYGGMEEIREGGVRVGGKGRDIGEGEREGGRKGEGEEEAKEGRQGQGRNAGRE